MNPKHQRSAGPEGGAAIAPFPPAVRSRRPEAAGRERVGTLVKTGRAAVIGPE